MVSSTQMFHTQFKTGSGLGSMELEAEKTLTKTATIRSVTNILPIVSYHAPNLPPNVALRPPFKKKDKGVAMAPTPRKTGVNHPS